MPEIGPTLREARMRARIDITEVEDATKIRAKYLRALENEEWNLLPGSTFIKSFLREYAAYLGLDARTLVEEYKLRYERPSEQELAPISPNLGGRERRGGAAPVPPRWTIATGLALVLLVSLYLIGLGDDPAERPAGPGTVPRATTTPATTPRTTATPPPTRAGVRLIPTGTVYVCLVDQDGAELIAGETLTAGQSVPLERARSMRLTLGNNQVRMRVNGREVVVAPSSRPIAYELTPGGARLLPSAAGPTCT
jgi:cytoskeleton protein RodZ